MTDTEWRDESDPHTMLRQLLRVGAGYRKMRLFSAACCRRVERLWPVDWARHAVTLAEQFADGRTSLEELRRAAGLARCEADLLWTSGRLHGGEGATLAAARSAASAVEALASQAWLFWETVRTKVARLAPDGKVERKDQCDLLRDIFGNPFRPANLEPSWLRWNDGTIPRIARGIYENRAFDGLPILHDALLDAGCDNDDILAHCRGAGPHVRGCWVIDLLLGKA